jgi:hypothetical protein
LPQCLNPGAFTLQFESASPRVLPRQQFPTQLPAFGERQVCLGGTLA